MVRIILPISDDIKEQLEALAVQNLGMNIYIDEISDILSEVEGNSSKEEIRQALSSRYEDLKGLTNQEDQMQRKRIVSAEKGYEILDGLLISAATVDTCELVLNILTDAQMNLFNETRTIVEDEAVKYFIETPREELSAKNFIELISRKIRIKDPHQKEFLEKKIGEAFEACKEAFSGGKPNEPLASKLYRVSTKAFTMALKALSVAASAGLFAANIISMMSVPADFGITFAAVGIIAKVISAIKPFSAKNIEKGLGNSSDTLSMTPQAKLHHGLARDVGTISKALLALTPEEQAKTKLSTLIALEKVKPHHGGKHTAGKVVKPSATPEKDVPEGSGGKEL